MNQTESVTSLAPVDAPFRIQRSIKKGWKLPPHSVIVTRPGLFGNPFIGPFAVEAHRIWINERVATTRDVAKMICDRERDLRATGVAFCPGIWNRTADEVIRRISELRGKNLACYCSLDEPCHADTLLEIANRQSLADAEAPDVTT